MNWLKNETTIYRQLPLPSVKCGMPTVFSKSKSWPYFYAPVILTEIAILECVEKHSLQSVCERYWYWFCIYSPVFILSIYLFFALFVFLIFVLFDFVCMFNLFWTPQYPCFKHILTIWFFEVVTLFWKLFFNYIYQLQIDTFFELLKQTVSKWHLSIHLLNLMSFIYMYI